jgi:ribosomal protein S12 methylthiotransferase
MKYHLITLGCPKNAVDSEGMQGLLLAQGHRPVESAEAADVVIVNTCSFIQAARDETVGILRDLAERKGPGQHLVAAGCMAESHRDQLLADVEGLDATLSTREWTCIPEVLTRFGPTGSRQPTRVDMGMIPLIALNSTEPAGPSIPLMQSQPETLGAYGDWRTTPITRQVRGPSAYLKISDGCNLRCAFCSIPSFKGDMRSKAMGAILGEARELIDGGVQEIILVAQHLTDYGRDLKLKDGLATLLEELCQVVPRDRWIRLMYAYPQSITPGVMRVIADHPQICRYLDMPLQHAHPATLRRMRRPPDTAKTEALIQELRRMVPDISLRTTFIVGFPGETREEYRELLSFLERMELDRAGFFRYSQEPGTPAASLPGQVSERVKQRRFDEAMALQQAISLQRNRRWAGRTLRILVEGSGTADDGSPLIVGRSYRDAPEIDGLVWARGTAPTGTFVDVVVERATAYDLWGTTGTLEVQRLAANLDTRQPVGSVGQARSTLRHE